LNRAIDKLQLGAFAFLGLATIFSVLAALSTQLYYIALIPFALMIIYAAVINFKLLFYFLLLAIPLSIEYSFSPSLGTDLPDEPLMIGLMLVTIVFIFANYKSLPTGYFTNVLIVALICYIFWILITAIDSTNFLVSFKVFLAKIWYVVTFAFLAAIVLRTKADLKKAFWCIFIPLTLLIIQVLVRQAMQHFTFEDVNKPMSPFFRNHVNYAAIMSVFFPFILALFIFSTITGTWIMRPITVKPFTTKILASIFLLLSKARMFRAWKGCTGGWRPCACSRSTHGWVLAPVLFTPIT
jgi:O-antigen ligase